MGSTFSPHAIFSSKMLSSSFSVASRMRIISPSLPQRSYNSIKIPARANVSGIIHSYRPSFRIPSSRIRTPLPVLSCSAHDQSFRADENDPRAVETVLKLYTAMKNKNFDELSDIIGEECLCICNFVSKFQPFRGKEQVLAFFSSLIKNLGNNIEFVVQPTFLDGMTVGVSWKLEWKNSRVPLGKGFSFYMCHVYQGKVFIKNVEMFLEPLFHIEPLRLKTIALFASAMDGISSRAAKLALKILLAVLLVALLLLFCRYPM